VYLYVQNNFLGYADNFTKVINVLLEVCSIFPKYQGSIY